MRILPFEPRRSTDGTSRRAGKRAATHVRAAVCRSDGDENIASAGNGGLARSPAAILCASSVNASSMPSQSHTVMRACSHVPRRNAASGSIAIARP